MDALADLFPGDPSQIGKGTSARGGGGREPGVKVPKLPPSDLQIDEPAGAFVTRAHPGSDRDYTGSVWNLRLSYDTVRGNPFTAFDKGVRQGCPDFSLLEGDLHVVAEGCEAELADHNAIRLTVTAEEFRLTVSGFDERDLKIEVREVSEEAEEEDEEEAA